MAQEHLVLGILREVSHERAVDLDGIDAQRLQMPQRGEAGAEIVERDAAAEIAKRADEAHGFLDVIERRGLGDLDHRAGWRARACPSAARSRP